MTEFEVKATGADGKFFGAKLPFSWLIKDAVDKMIFQARHQSTGGS